MQPNVLFVVLDAARYDHFSLNGYDRRTTPQTDSLAADAVTFDSAFAAAPWTPPSHASMFTGTYPSTHGYFDAGMELRGPTTLAETLSAAGYRTFGSLLNPKIGDQTEISRGFDDYLPLYRLPFRPESIAEARDYYLDLLPGYARFLRDYFGMDRKPAEHVAVEAFTRRIRSGDRPFFGFINISSPHSQYHAPRRFRERFESFDPDEVRMDVVNDLAFAGGYKFMAGEIEPTQAEWDAVMDWYDGEIAFGDAFIGDIVDTLERAGVYDETMIVVTADHGEHFGEFGRAYHQFSLFDELIHVPLVVKLPGGERGGTRRDDLVSHVDLAPTIYEALGVDTPEGVEGTGMFSGGEREAVFAEYGDPETAIKSLESNTDREISPEVYDELDHGLQCVRTHMRKLVRRLDGETIRTRIDDDGERLLADDEEADDGAWADLERLLDETLSPHGDTGSVQIAEGTEEQLRKLGYL